MYTRIKRRLRRPSFFFQEADMITVHCNRLVDSWSRAPDQIQMCPDRDTIAQLLPSRRILLHD